MSNNSSSWLTSFRKFIAPIICLYLLLEYCSASRVIRKNGVVPTSHDSMTSSRDPKNLFPFVWVTFQPSPCGPDSSTTSIKDGVCVQRGKCQKRGGNAGNGMCRDGFGDCCKFTEMCNGTQTQIDVNQLVTTLESPSPINQECTFRFRKEDNICQIRLDFKEFTSMKANEDGICDVDRLRIRNSITVSNEFTTCGNLKDQHMYLTFGSQDMIEVTPMLRSTTAQYKIVATRIPCDSKNRAPDYCLQYFTQTSGTVKSFDYGVQQQSNQMYTVCVKPTTQSSEIQWKSCMPGSAGTGTNSFDIISNPNPTPLMGDQCTTDWVEVKGTDKQCQTFATTKSAWKPYELLVNFDKMEVPPPPPTFTVYVDPANCASTCTAYSVTDMYDCGCIGMTPNQMCQCVVLAPGAAAGAPVPPAPPAADIGNTGFCLEFMQL